MVDRNILSESKGIFLPLSGCSLPVCNVAGNLFATTHCYDRYVLIVRGFSGSVRFPYLPCAPGEVLKKATNWLLFLLMVVVLFASSACVPAQSVLPGAPSFAQEVTLPGQQLWKQGVSSFLFGTNDTEEWFTNNIETQPAIQQALRVAGFPLIRSFFLDNASDAAIEARIRTIENSGAHCLGVITNIFHTAYDLHLVKYLGNRCLLYEFGNEPDYSGIPVSQYVSQWRGLVPQLRRANPQARFIGPVLGLKSLNYLADFLAGVKSARVLPDAISLHWYPCWQVSQSTCMALAGSISSEISEARIIVQHILGEDLPIGVTEWNFDPGNPPAAYGDKADFMLQFTRAALFAMIQSGVAFACQFDAASYAGYGHLDLFNVSTNQPKPQYYALKSLIEQYRPSSP